MRDQTRSPSSARCSPRRSPPRCAGRSSRTARSTRRSARQSAWPVMTATSRRSSRAAVPCDWSRSASRLAGDPFQRGDAIDRDSAWCRARPGRDRHAGGDLLGRRAGGGRKLRRREHRLDRRDRHERAGARLARAEPPGRSAGAPRRHRAAHPQLAPASQIEADPHYSLSNFTGNSISMVSVNKDGARVLVVDDEPNITELVAMALRYEGFNVKTAATGRGALTAVTQFAPSLVILDVMLPDIDGIEVLKRMNSAGNKVPIIFLTAKDATEDKVHGLTIGGDDYVTKPFSIEELMARVRVVLRRHGSDSETGKLSLADLELDDEAHEVRRHGHVVELTNTEYRLLRYLLINAGRVLTRSQILDHVWHYDFGGDASVHETYISYLRRKVDRYDPPLVQTVRGVGYVLRTPRK